MGVDLVGVQIVTWLQEAHVLHRPHEPLRIAVEDRVEARCEALPLVAAPALHQPEVEEADPAIGVEAVVARMGVAVERRGAGWMPVRNAR